MADRLDEALRPHLARADRLIVARMADSRAHALRGDIVTAAQRLADLHHALAGPNGTGIVGDARAAFYRDAYRHTPFDPDLHDPDRRLPTAESAEKARTAPIGGLDAHRDLGLRVEQVRKALVAAVGNPTAIDTWHRQQSNGLRAWARRTLSDAQISIDAATQFLRLRPEFRDGQDPVGAG